ncbi:MAG: peptidylprolyl isomerase [Leadbetterella sp.]
MKKIATLVLVCACYVGNAQKKDILVKLETSLGSTHIILYDETPLHKANFLKLVGQKFYDSLLFHRVIKNFMVQGGDPNSKNAAKGARLGNGGSNLERIPFEFTPLRPHKKGTIAAARDNNPQKASSACQFYIVQGKKLTDSEIMKVEASKKISYTNEQKADYIALGGTPFLDNDYTVFGQLLDNIELVDKLAEVSKDANDRPYDDMPMKMTLVKMKKKKIVKKFGYKYPAKIKK